MGTSGLLMFSKWSTYVQGMTPLDGGAANGLKSMTAAHYTEVFVWAPDGDTVVSHYCFVFVCLVKSIQLHSLVRI